MFENRPVSNAMQALQGASANLIIQQRNMNPNDNNMSINIRGISTMGNNDPLVVIQEPRHLHARCLSFYLSEGRKWFSTNCSRDAHVCDSWGDIVSQVCPNWTPAVSHG